MRRGLVLFIVMVAMLALAHNAHASSGEYVDGAASKLIRGIVNVLTGWVELPAQIAKGYNEGFMGNENNKLVGSIAGIFDGVFHTAGRTLSGAGDIASFWAANPKDNEGVGFPLDAEYAWEKGTPYNAFDPNLEEGAVKPVGNKLLRGLGNTIFGFVEIPGQIAKGIKNGSPDLGIIKGVWYFCSREISGSMDLTTLLLPIPKDNKGMAFDEKWPWSALTDIKETK